MEEDDRRLVRLLRRNLEVLERSSHIVHVFDQKLSNGSDGSDRLIKQRDFHFRTFGELLQSEACRTGVESRYETRNGYEEREEDEEDEQRRGSDGFGDVQRYRVGVLSGYNGRL